MRLSAGMGKAVFVALGIWALGVGSATAQLVIHDPGNLSAFRNTVGAVLTLRLTGEEAGAVWGDRVYSDDTRPARAAVHAGVLGAGETALVEVEIAGPQESFEAALRNGVQSQAWPGGPGSYIFLEARPAPDTPPDPGNLTSYRNDVGSVFRFVVTGRTGGGIWGDGIYTDDSRLALAAVHAGVLAPDETGIVTVRILGPQQGFTGGERNGVTSNTYGAYSGSYSFIVTPMKDGAGTP